MTGEAEAIAHCLREHYGIQSAVLQPIEANSFNRVFLVRTADGRRVARLSDPLRIHAPGAEHVEAAWLEELAALGFDAPRVVRTTTGDASVLVGSQSLSLFDHLPGQPAASHAENISFAEVGRLLAELHDQSVASAVDASPLGEMRRVIYFPEADLVSTHVDESGTRFDQAVERAQAELDRLWASQAHAPQLIHGDFGPHNLLVAPEGLRVIDFQDVQVGFPVQDLAIAKCNLDRFGHVAWVDVCAGYQDVRAMPAAWEAFSEALTASRRLNLMNLGLHLRRPGLDEHLRRHGAIVKAWLAPLA